MFVLDFSVLILWFDGNLDPGRDLGDLLMSNLLVHVSLSGLARMCNNQRSSTGNVLGNDLESGGKGVFRLPELLRSLHPDNLAGIVSFKESSAFGNR